MRISVDTVQVLFVVLVAALVLLLGIVAESSNGLGAQNCGVHQPWETPGPEVPAQCRW